MPKKGYTIKPPSSPDYIADIYRKDKPLAFYTRQDTILVNPFAKVEEKHLEQLKTLAKTTAISCGICTEKPYGEKTAKEEENGVVRINQHNGVVLSCKYHPLLGYVLSTYREDTRQGGIPIQRQYFYNKEAAFEDFALRSGLVDAKKLFNETELTILHSGLVKLRMMDSDLDREGLDTVGALIRRIEETVPGLTGKGKGLGIARKFPQLEHLMERER
ncbi:MAG: hypothetical protein K2N63_01705 [Lachnospiraceae bacterium]|nr:hypothetical protein [Lachnospiraceae bacterium]